MTTLRAVAVLGLLAAVPGSSVARAPVEPVLNPAEMVSPARLLAQLATAFEIEVVPDAVVDQLIRFRLGVRDLLHGATERLAGIAQLTGFRIPDLTVLSAQPVAPSQSTWATSGFGWREDPIRKRKKFHRGDDIRAKSGTPVFAAGDGVVVFAGRQGGYGNVIYVDHGGGVVTRYGHLRRIEATLDTAISAGQQIGQVGSTGRTTGPHLHFEVRLDGRAVDPSTAMTVAELGRESPAAGQVASFALAPEMQENYESPFDPPREAKKAKRKAKAEGSRPERTGRAKRVRPVS
ncbi:MAG: M23 family metallopeptidase [Deltaproteobacteria bacterium]|nr:M23 family metallopeptidase [Deltaproteobacteria bacterium]